MSDTLQLDVSPPDNLDELGTLFESAARLATSASDDQSLSKVEHFDSDTTSVPSTSSENVVSEPRNVTKESQEERTLDRNWRIFSGVTSESNWRVGNKSAKENKEERPLNSNWRVREESAGENKEDYYNWGTTKASSDRKNPSAIKNETHKQQNDSFTVTGLLCQVNCRGSDKWFYVQVEDEPFTNERLKCYFRFLSDSSVPLIEYKTKFLLGVKFVSDYDDERGIKVLWVNPLEYIKLTSSDVLEAFDKLPFPMTHEEIIQKLYFTWRKYLMALLSQAHQFDEEALTEILNYILPHDEPRRVVQTQEHQCRFKEIIKLFSSRESSFLLRLNQFDFIGKEELVKELIELVATTNNSLDPVCHLLRRYYEDDNVGLLNLIEKCCKGFDISLHSLGAQDFRDLPLIPVMEELKGVISAEVFGDSLNPTVQRLLQLESHLLPNRTVGPWESPEEFLNVHFRLLREECFASIRDRIARVRSEPTNDQLVHRDVKLVSYAIGDGSFVLKIKFKPSKIRANLMFGNLLCLDVDTNFSNPIWATVKSANRGSEISILLVGVGGNNIDNLDNSPSARVVIPALQRLIATQSGVMVESPTYYNAFRPVLARLQNLTSSDFPFASEILVQSVEPQPSPIKFVGADNFPGLDDSQRLAAEAALKNRFSLIQGPPGCGKTFVGKDIVLTMLNSVHVENEESDEEDEIYRQVNGISLKLFRQKFSVKAHKRPILVISYKNHALDSFLESCLKLTKGNSDPISLARIGGRSTSEAVAKFDLHNQAPIMKNYLSKEKFMELLYARNQLHGFAEKVEKAAAKSLISFTPSALIDFLTREQGTNGKQQLYSLMVRNFTENYRKIIGQENYECDSPEEAVTDVLRIRNTYGRGAETAEKILKLSLDQWLSETESEKFLPKPQTSLFINTVQPESIKDEDEEIEEDEWEEIVAERFVGSESKLKFNDISRKKIRMYETLQKRLENLEPDGREKEVCGVADVWTLTSEGRYVLLSFWIREWRKEIDENLAEALDEYNNFYRQIQVLEQERNVEFLKSRDLIACTITGCCLRMAMIARVAPSIVIVEEAAEILESQLIAALPSSVQHVVLLGDHQQLPPQVHHFRLKQQYNLGVSIFERLAKNGYPISQLRFHRRGPKSLCPLFSRFYQHEIIPTKEDPKLPEALSLMGLMYWWSHQAPASRSPNGTSFENEFEALMVVGAIRVLILLGGVEASRMSVVTGYLGQAKKIEGLLAENGIESVSVCTVDRYQGDENDFIFLSLTRSLNEKTEGQPSLGFLASENRACVALSRARLGLYIFGCSALFQAHPTWTNVVEYFREKGKLSQELHFKFSTTELSFEHPYDFAMLFKKLQLENENMKLEIYTKLAKELPKLKPGIHDVTEEFSKKMESLMNHSILSKRDLGIGRDCDGEKYHGFKVIKVRRIFKKEARLMYLHHREIIERSKPPLLDFKVDSKADWMIPELNSNANEFFFFHGTKPEIVEIIAESGFDERVANVGLYGAGIYFAENADKADQYTSPSGITQERFMFLARVTLGNPYKTTISYSDRRPPPINPEKPTKLYDSVIAVSSRKGAEHATSQRHQEFIVFDRYQCIPEFIIHYRRQ